MRRLKTFWQEFRDAAPGNRFRDRYRRRRDQRHRGQTQLSRPIIVVLALLCCIVAIPLMITPGPAFVFWGLAAFLIAGESAWAARMLDWIELKGREWWGDWRRSRARQKPAELDR